MKKLKKLQVRVASESCKVGQPWPTQVSQLSLDLKEQRRRRCQGASTAKEVKDIKSSYRKPLADAALKSYKNHIANLIDAVVQADAKNDSKEWWKACHRIGRSTRYSNTQPAASSPEDLAERFASHAESLFSATQLEASRQRFPMSPASTRTHLVPDHEECVMNLEALANNKAAGPSGLPKELYSRSTHAREALIKLVQAMFEKEEVPDEMPIAELIFIFKGKGSRDDLAQYRGLALEEAATKLMSAIMLSRLISEVSLKSRPLNQFGFSKKRSVRDSCFILRSLIDLAIDLDEKLIVIFIDFQKAFDTVSHSLLEEALRASGASDKSIAMYRALYSKAKAKVRVTAPGGRRVYSRTIPINRGVLQGNLLSPLYFILALEHVFKKIDTGSSFSVLGLFIDALFYADDSALLCASIEEATTRLTAFTDGFAKLADMHVHPGKTKCMHAQKTIQVAKPAQKDYLEEDATDLLHHKCDACGRNFFNKHGLAVHKGRWCDWFQRLDNKEYEVQEILEARGPPENRFYFVTWKNYPAKENCWVPRGWCSCDKLIEAFWKSKGLPETDTMPEDPNPELGEKHGHCFRCVHCCKFFKTASALKTHHTKGPEQPGGCKCKPASRSGTLAEAALMRLRRKEAQKDLGHVIVKGTKLENVLGYTYLGSEVEADGNTKRAIQVRLAIAMKQFGDFMNIWKAEVIPLHQKLLLYSAGVVSRLIHGHETWRLDDKSTATLKSWNARCLATITGNSIADEYRHPTFPLVEKLRARRLRWAGQILRQDASQSLPKQVLTALVQAELDPDSPQNSPHLDLLMDAPSFTSIEELLALSEDKHAWATAVRNLDPDLPNDMKPMENLIYTKVKTEPKNSELDPEAPEWHKCYFY